MSYNIISMLNKIPTATFGVGVLLTTLFGANVLMNSYQKVSRREYLKSLIDPYGVNHNHQDQKSLDECQSCVAKKQLQYINDISSDDVKSMKYVLCGSALIIASYLMVDVKTYFKL